MEFLFLNEEAHDENSFEQMKVFAESVGIDVSDVTSKSLEEVMLEAAEGFHEAEVAAMQEEFSLFQESVNKNDEYFLQEGVLETVGKTLKNWWAKIKKFCVKLWTKIVHYFWVAVQWCRKTIQSAIQKFHGAKTIFVPKPLVEFTSKEIKNLESQVVAPKVNKVIKLLQDNSTFDDSDNGSIKIKDAQNLLEKESLNTLDVAVENVKRSVKNQKLKGLDDKGKKITTSEKGSMEEIPFSTWKKLMDDSLKSYENTKKLVETANKACQQAISKNDKALEDYFKKHGSADSKQKSGILLKGKVLRLCSSASAKIGAKMTKVVRWTMGALFSYSSYKSPKSEKTMSTGYNKDYDVSGED